MAVDLVIDIENTRARDPARTRTPRLATLVTALALTALAAAAATAAAPAKPAAKPTCQRAHSTTVAGNRLVRVFTRPGRDGSNEGTDLLGCWKTTGRVRPLAFAFDDGFVASAQFGLVRVRGRFAAFYSETYDVGCKAECPPGYEPTHRHLTVVDVRLGSVRRVRIAEPPAGPRLLLDEHGAIAWPRWLPANQVEVRVLDAAGERALDSGAIRPESLALTPRGRLSWDNAGTLRGARLEHRTS
jgi:hypothetical protein